VLRKTLLKTHFLRMARTFWRCVSPIDALAITALQMAKDAGLDLEYSPSLPE
jgi:hypothetical protein